MSYYKDIYNDFPLRCAKLWEKMRDVAEKEGLDVTFMLMTAAAGFATPFEHLKIQPGQAKDNKDHPAFYNYDEEKYKDVLSKMQEALGSPVQKSPLFSKLDLAAWYHCEVKSVEMILAMVESSSRSGNKLMSFKAGKIVKILRNAIAHNNIYAFNRKPSTEIDEIAFFSEIREYNEERISKVIGYDVLAMPAQDLGAFLDAWFGLLRKSDRKGKLLKLSISEALKDHDDQFAA